MRGKAVVVETGLAEEVEWRGESYVRHARTRFVEVASMPDAARPPELGDPWDPLTVRARLHRMADVYRRLPHTPDTKPGGYRSCMPEPIKEIFKDQPADPMRLPVALEDLRAADVVADIIPRLAREQCLVLWSIALKVSDRRLARVLGVSHPTAANRKQQLLKMLAGLIPERPDEHDLQLARDSIHRNLA